MASVAQQLISEGRPAIDVITAAKVVEHLSGFGIGWSEIDEYCRERFPEAPLARYYVISALVLLSGCHVGVHIGCDIVSEKVPGLVFDDDGLLLVDAAQAEYHKEGVLIGEYLLHYSDCLLRYNLALQGGFLGALAECARAPGARVRVAINPHIVLSRDYWSRIYHRVFIRGPKAPSEAQLADPYFPQVATGEVTEYRRLGNDPVLELTLPLDATQIMWTRRSDRKTIQIEELVPTGSSRCRRVGHVTNRYMHSIWDMETAAFVHIDGAVRMYRDAAYELRKNSDLRNHDGKADYYMKLFRIDGVSSVERWSEFTWRFFFGNELVVEYLDSM